MARVYKRFVGPLQLAGSAADLYTVPASTVARVLAIHASNPSGSPVDINLSIGADAAATRVYDDYPVAADTPIVRFDPYDLAAGEKIQGWAGSAGAVVLTVTGWEQPSGAGPPEGLTAYFDEGVDGDDITTAAGEANYTAWDTVDTGGGVGPKYDDAHVVNGSLAAKLDAGPGDNGGYLKWDAAVGTQTDYYGRIYFFIAANPSSNLTPITVERTGGTGHSWSCFLLTDGKLRLNDQSFGTFATSTNSIATNVWIRLEWHMVHATGAYEFKLFNTFDSETPTETMSGSGAGLGADANSIRFRLNAVSHTAWLDGIQVFTSSYPGPL